MADQFGLSDPFDTSPLYQAPMHQAPMQQAFGAFPGGAPAAPAPAAPKPAGAARPAAPAAPAQPGKAAPADPQQAMLQQFFKQATSGPTPEAVESAYGQYGKDVGAAEDEYLQGVEERMKTIQEAAPLRQAAPQYADFAKQTSPLAMIMMAFGGKAFGLSGQNMLGAMTGMVQGTNEGNQQRYEQAYQQWKDAYSQAKDHYEQVKDVMGQLDKLAQGNMQRKQQAAQTALEMIGVKEDFAKQGMNGFTALSRVMEQAKNQSENLDMKHQQLQIQRDRLQQQKDKQHSKEGEAVEKAEDVTEKYVYAAEDLKGAWDRLKAYVEGPQGKKLRTGIDLSTISSSALLTRIQQSGDSEAARLLSDYKSAEATFKGPGFRSQIEGIPASALRVAGVDKAELSALPSLQDTGWNQTGFAIDRAVTQGKRMQDKIKRKSERFRQSSAAAPEPVETAGASSGDILAEADAIIGQ